MAAPTITWGTVGNSTNGSSVAVNLPASVAGDLLLLFTSYDSTTAPTTPTNWNAFASNGNNSSELHAFWKIAVGSEGTSVTVAGPNQDYVHIGGKIAAAEHAVTVVGDMVVPTAATAASGNADPPASGTVAAKDWLVIVACVIDMTTGDSISAAPASYSSATLTKSANSTSSCGLGVATRGLSGATSEDPGTFTNTSRAWRAATYLIPPPPPKSTVNVLLAERRSQQHLLVR